LRVLVLVRGGRGDDRPAHVGECDDVSAGRQVADATVRVGKDGDEQTDEEAEEVVDDQQDRP
jgi:hypothetical protein